MDSKKLWIVKNVSIAIMADEVR